MPCCRSTWRAAAAAAVLALAWTAAAPALAESHEERRLADQTQRLAEVREQIEAAQDEVALTGGQLAQAEAQLATVLEAVRAADEAVLRSERAVEGARERLAAALEQREQQEEIAAEHAIERYKQGEDLSLQAMLTADSTSEVLDRSAYLDVIGESERRRTEELTAAARRVDAERQALEAEEASLERVREQQGQILAEVERLRDERVLLLAAETTELEALQIQESHLESDALALEALARAPAGPRSAAPPAVAGGWIWPTDGSVTSEFGQRWGRLHAGIDVAAPTGTPIVAAQAGCVSFAGRQGGYGNLVLVDHGGGTVTAYAHQSRLLASAGTCLAQGEQLGEVGSTGNSTGPHLHFEVRVGGAARNPRPYLP